MTLFRDVLRRWPLAAGLALVFSLSPLAFAQQAAVPARLASLQPAPGESALVPFVRWAQGARQTVAGVQDYSCTFVKREKVGDALLDHQYLFIKVRHNPFSVYLYFLGPAELKGREAIYVEGKNSGNILAHATGIKNILGTLSLRPDSTLAMQGNRHPITKIGLLNLTGRMIDSGEAAAKLNQTEVKHFPGTKVNDRLCTCLLFSNPQRRPEFQHQMTRIFIDDELNLPIRYEAYEWPDEAGEAPELVEEYTYVNLKFNNNFTDADFDPKNANYGFR